MLEHIVIPAAEEFQPDLVLISAAYDAHRDERLGGCELEVSSFAEMARHIRGLGDRTGAPVGAVLEGGYALDTLDASVCAAMEALAGDQPPDSVAPDYFTCRADPTSAFTGDCERSRPGESIALSRARWRVGQDGISVAAARSFHGRVEPPPSADSRSAGRSSGKTRDCRWFVRPALTPLA